MYYVRMMEQLLENTVLQRPLVYLNGARQVGKSTLTQHIRTSKGINYITMDSPLVLTAIKNDPVSFIASLPRDKVNVLDEIQLAQEAFAVIKMEIDKARLAGNGKSLYILTGSANLMALPSLAAALVGRMSILTLYPLCAGEYKKTGVNFIKKLYQESLTYKQYSSQDELIDIMSNATYPELAADKGLDRTKWLDDYITTIIQRDVRNIADIRNPEQLVKLLTLFATRVGGMINNSAVMKEIGLDNKTYEKYKAIIMNTFLSFEVRPWTTVAKINKKFTKSPKLYFTDVNVLCYFLQENLSVLYQKNKTVFGSILENFIAVEILKNISICPNMSMSYFRTLDNKEVDFVLEDHQGDVIGIEVKASRQIGKNDMAGLLELQAVTQKKFKKGIIFYTGKELLALQKDIWAVPIDYIWTQD